MGGIKMKYKYKDIYEIFLELFTICTRSVTVYSYVPPFIW